MRQDEGGWWFYSLVCSRSPRWSHEYFMKLYGNVSYLETLPTKHSKCFGKSNPCIVRKKKYICTGTSSGSILKTVILRKWRVFLLQFCPTQLPRFPTFMRSNKMVWGRDSQFSVPGIFFCFLFSLYCKILHSEQTNC